MLPRPLVDLVGQPDPAGVQVRDRLGEVAPAGEAMHLLAADPENLRDLRDTSQPEAIHARRLGTVCASSHEIGNIRHSLPDH